MGRRLETQTQLWRSFQALQMALDVANVHSRMLACEEIWHEHHHHHRSFHLVCDLLNNELYRSALDGVDPSVEP